MPDAFRALAVTAGLVIGTFSFAGGLVTNLLKAYIPNIDIPSLKVPKLGTPTSVPTSNAGPAVGKEGGLKNFVGGVGRVIPAVGGLWAGNEIANEYGDDLGGNIISQKPGDCYTESTTSSEKIHVPCSELKGGSK
jgi:hypothetical protein